MAPTYSIYGLTVDSDWRFPELPAGNAPADIVVRRSAAEFVPRIPGVERQTWASGRTADLLCRRRGSLHIHSGREIVVHAAAGSDERIVRNWILCQGLGVLMFQRGYLVLNASVVRWNGSIVAFVGGAGAGKSTLAAALCQQGGELVEDDHAVIAEGFEPTVLPGPAQIQLNPDSLERLESADALGMCGRVSEEKLGWHVWRPVVAPGPLERIYVLADGDSHRVTPLTTSQATRELVQHSFLRRLLIEPHGVAPHARRCAALASVVSVQRLERPRSFNELPRLISMLQESIERSDALV